MSNALQTSASDLTRSLHKALNNSDLDQNIAFKAKEIGREIADANRPDYPKIKLSVAKLGRWSWGISFTAPSLWVGTFGSKNSEGRQFNTRINLNPTVGMRGDL